MKSEQKLKALRDELNELLIERSEMIDLLLVGLIARCPVFLGGDPGEGKTFAAGAIAQSLEMTTRYHLFSPDTMPDEFLGSVDLVKLNEGIYTRDIEGGLATAQVFIADELFKANSPSRNVQLGILNEKRYQNGKEAINCPLQLYVGMSNELPSDRGDRAFWDRMLLRHWVKPVSVTGRRILMQRTARILPIPEVSARLSMDDLEELRAEAEGIEFSVDALEKTLEVISLIAKEGLEISTRQCNQAVSLLKAYALVQGETQVRQKHLSLLCSMFWNKQSQIQRIQAIIAAETGDKSREVEAIREWTINTYATIRKERAIAPRALMAHRSTAQKKLIEFNTISDLCDEKLRDATAEAIGDLFHLIEDALNKLTTLS